MGLQCGVVTVEEGFPDLFQPRPHFVRCPSEAASPNTRFILRQTEKPTENHS